MASFADFDNRIAARVRAEGKGAGVDLCSSVIRVRLAFGKERGNSDIAVICETVR
jgi:hypothetical protein